MKHHGNVTKINGAEVEPVDVVEVVGAEWKKYNDVLECSACGFGYFPTGCYFRNGECTGNCVFTFCPSCGACMTRKSGGKQK